MSKYVQLVLALCFMLGPATSINNGFWYSYHWSDKSVTMEGPEGTDIPVVAMIGSNGRAQTTTALPTLLDVDTAMSLSTLTANQTELLGFNALFAADMPTLPYTLKVGLWTQTANNFEPSSAGAILHWNMQQMTAVGNSTKTTVQLPKGTRFLFVGAILDRNPANVTGKLFIQALWQAKGANPKGANPKGASPF